MLTVLQQQQTNVISQVDLGNGEGKMYSALPTFMGWRSCFWLTWEASSFIRDWDQQCEQAQMGGIDWPGSSFIQAWDCNVNKLLQAELLLNSMNHEINLMRNFAIILLGCFSMSNFPNMIFFCANSATLLAIIYSFHGLICVFLVFSLLWFICFLSTSFENSC